MEDGLHKGGGTLYLVATPIGNLEDITRRAERVLREVDLVAAEDTRRAGILLTNLGIEKPLDRHDKHTEHDKTGSLIAQLQAGKDIALVSDAGVPVVSDPGSHLVEQAHAAGIHVCPIPGPSAVLSAIAASGFCGDQFVFDGYPPRKVSERRAFYAALEHRSMASVVFEAPHRLLESLQDAVASLGHDREVVVAREITKQFEEITRMSLGRALDHFTETEPQGEFTLVVSPADAPEEHARASAPAEAVKLLAETDLPTKQAAHILAAACGITKKEAYASIVAMRTGPVE